MTESGTRRRIRDPVHGLIVFEDRPIDQLAWALIDTPEFQRLRRIRQLGVSEIVFPGAVHTRFAHSIGVFHNARLLVEVIHRESSADQKSPLSDVAQIAALLHDLGHGPFSHTFESVQLSRGVNRRHEQWTAEIIRNPDGRIRPLLDDFRSGFAEEVAALLEKEDPEDIHHAVVSSSFDADRLDYLRRDKLMTGTGAGGIDFDWLMENLRVREIEIDAPDEEETHSRRVPTFCLTEKALPAAEQFLLARYTLHQQVYFHKTTRCLEHMIGKLLRAVAGSAANKAKAPRATGLPREHPLLRFFAKDGESVRNYLALDDHCVFGALDAMSRATDSTISEMATRITTRDLYKPLDLSEFGSDEGRQRQRLRHIKRDFRIAIGDERVMIDDKAAVGIYSQIGGDDEKMHKKVHILDAGQPKEISQLSRLIEALSTKKSFTRVYFDDESDRDRVRRIGREQ